MRPSHFEPPPLRDAGSIRVEFVIAREPAEVLVDGVRARLSADESNERARDTRAMLIEILQDRSPHRDVSRYLRVDRIVVDPLTRPRSHPILTLDAEYSAHEEHRLSMPNHWKLQMDMLRSVLVHELLHLSVGPPNERGNPRLCALLRELKKIPPLADIPVPPILETRLGAHARASADLHIVVNWLELQANKRFLAGVAEARALVAGVAAYEEIYRAVVRCDEEIGEVMRRPEFRGLMPEAT